MGGECIDLMNECIFVGGLVANVQSGARSYFLRLQLANKGFGSEGPAARMAARVCFVFFLPRRPCLRGIRVSVHGFPVHFCKRLKDIFREMLL